MEEVNEDAMMMDVDLENLKENGIADFAKLASSEELRTAMEQIEVFMQQKSRKQGVPLCSLSHTDANLQCLDQLKRIQSTS